MGGTAGVEMAWRAGVEYKNISNLFCGNHYSIFFIVHMIDIKNIDIFFSKNLVKVV